MAQARDGTVGEGSLELACAHLCDTFGCKVHDDICWGKISNDGCLGMRIVWATQLAFITAHHPIGYYIIDPVRQFLVMVLNEQGSSGGSWAVVTISPKK